VCEGFAARTTFPVRQIALAVNDVSFVSPTENA